ncbi:MAG: autotransporter-associated beta strand protein [Pseudoalteromonas tetraodonis]|jgi:autotransporter-associated beta strand protein
MALACAVLVCAAMAVQAESNEVKDPTGILRKPIPEKLVALTFDDGCASHKTTVAPILKSLGFGGTFYICDGFSFGTRKDWYLTWRQIKGMAADGFEIGNHTVGHQGGAGFDNFQRMEDRLLAHGCPETTTVCWPVYHVNTGAYADLAANGYTFGRGGHNRPYRPTRDNPFDVPSFTIMDGVSVEKFVNQARQATDGKIVVFCYHGVPDGEHPQVGLEPAVFKAQMQYLKDNNYKVVALRDLAEYIDSAEAAKLPPTARWIKDSRPATLAKEVKPYVVLDNAKPKVDAPPTKTPPPNPTAKTAAVTYGPNDRVVKFDKGGSQVFAEPTTLASNLAMDVGNGEVKMPSLISGPGGLIKSGKGRLTITKADNTFRGGTVINDGMLMMFVQAHEALGSGPITLNGGILGLEYIHGTNALILNGGTIYAGNGVGNSWNSSITLNGNTIIDPFARLDLNNKSGGISGSGGFTIEGRGDVILNGINTYTGPTTVRKGRLSVRKAASLYNAAPASWTPAKITVFNTAAIHLSVGGEGQFTSGQASTLLYKLTTGVHSSGLMTGSIFALDTSDAEEAQELSVNIADAKGPGRGSFTIKKCGTGTLQLSGNNTYTGRTILESGTLSVASLNRVVGGKSSSSLGAPTTLDIGMIDFVGNCTLKYTGGGEVSDRIIDLTGQKQTVTFDQSGSGQLKFTSPFDISGFGHSKALVLTGSTTGTGELAGNLDNPYDRKKLATMALTKTGTGVWRLSGSNGFTGPTTVAEGTLSLTNTRSLSANTEVTVAENATLDLAFEGEMQVKGLVLDGKAQASGKYSATSTPNSIKGSGVLNVRPAKE